MSHKLNVSYERSYRSKNKGTKTYVYKVTGSKEALAAYQEAQGEFFRPDTNTGEPLYFTTRYMGERGQLLVTDSNKVVADMSEFEKAASLVSQFDGVFAEKLAEASINKLMGSHASAPSAPAAPQADSTMDI